MKKIILFSLCSYGLVLAEPTTNQDSQHKPTIIMVKPTPSTPKLHQQKSPPPLTKPAKPKAKKPHQKTKQPKAKHHTTKHHLR